MKPLLATILSALILAACNGGGGSSSTNNDQTDPTDNDNTSSTNGRVACLLKRLNNLPSDQKKVVELSAQAVIACKATEADLQAFLKKRKK